MPHRSRPKHDPLHPVHVTLRGRREVAAFRTERVGRALREAVRASERPGFRVLHFSFQRDHAHFIVEAHEGALSSGLQGLAIRLARAANKAIGRLGSVWAERYHARALASPRAVRNALVYVLFNHRKHGHHGHVFDPWSSVAWFEGLAPMPRTLWAALPARAGPSPVAPPRTWLARAGWQRGGLVGVHESPRAPG